MALYSNSSKEYLEKVVVHFNLISYFDYMECVNDNNLQKIDLAERILKRYSYKKAILVGDRKEDMIAALNNKLPPQRESPRRPCKW